MKKYFSILIIIFLCSSCKKDWLDEKPTSNLKVPSTISDFQQLLDDQGPRTLSPTTGDQLFCGSDDYNVPENFQSAIDPVSATYYIWAAEGYKSNSETNWSSDYSKIYTDNLALEGLNKISKTSSNANAWNQAYGTALFSRGINFYTLSQIFTKPYDQNTASTDLGIPLRLTTNLNQKVGRGTVQQLYAQMINDLSASVQYLFTGPQPYQQFARPTKAAAYAYLSRIYLISGDYQKAMKYCDSTLQYQSTLLDFNTLHPTSTTIRMPPYYQNPEVFFATPALDGIIGDKKSIDSLLYKSYDDNDLRKKYFFNPTILAGRIQFSGSYYGLSRNSLEYAPCVDELYLIKAECHARSGDAVNAMKTLNTLLQNRWVSGTFPGYTAADADDALRIVLRERRKELVARGTRWLDMRRLNKDPRFQVTVTRTFLGKTYTLTPNSNWYAWPIPKDELLFSGISDNPR